MKKYIAAFQLTASVNHLAHRPRFSPRSHDVFSGCAYNPRISVILSGNNRDDEELYNSQSSRRRSRKRDPIIDTIRKDDNVPLAFVESLTTFLLRPISLPSIGAGENKIIVPLAYVASISLSVFVLPFTTWVLLALFNGVYIALANTFIEDDKGYSNSDEDEDEVKSNGNIPLAAFTGALASATLLSPDGLISTSSSFSLVTLAAIVALSLGGLAVFMGARNTVDDEIRWRENDFRESRLREERERMDLWDNEIDAAEK